VVVGGSNTTGINAPESDEILRLQAELEGKRQELLDKTQTIDRLVRA